MTFLAIDAQKNLFTLQKSQLQFEYTLIMNRANQMTKEMGLYEAAQDSSWDAETDPYYQQLASTEQYLETRGDSIDSQITALDNEISSMKNMVNNNIKSSCSLNLIGG